jgi:protein tyrosine phosphatase
MVNPNKYIRKAIYDAVNATYPCFDTQVTGNLNPTQYVIISTQDKEDLNPNKCAHRWQVATLLDLVCIYNGAGNVGSRLTNDDMEETIKNLILNLQVTGFNVLTQRNEYPSNLDSSTETQTVYRNFIRVILTLE